jgi:hypothetical protein
MTLRGRRVYWSGWRWHWADTGNAVLDDPPITPVGLGAHPLERQAYFLTGYLATTPDHVRQDLRDLIRAAGVDMPKEVAPQDSDPNARPRNSNDTPTDGEWSSEYMGNEADWRSGRAARTAKLVRLGALLSRLMGYPRDDPNEDHGPGKTGLFK